MSARLEAATKQYGVTLLLTDAMYNELSYNVCAQCRPLDRVTVKGSTEPVTLYTHDTSPTGKESCLALPSTSYEDHQIVMSKINSKKSDEMFDTFNNNWKTGFNYYVNGHWSKALQHFHICYTIRPWDTPLSVLTKYIREAGVTINNGETKTVSSRTDASNDVNICAPDGWRGFRSLNSK
jgi:hypothetical protein